MVSNKTPPDYDGSYELRAFQIENALRERGHNADMATGFLRPGFKLEEPEVAIESRYTLAKILDQTERTFQEVVARSKVAGAA